MKEQVNQGFRGRNGCHGDGDGDADGNGDHVANTVEANEVWLQGFKVSKTNLQSAKSPMSNRQ